MKSTVLVSLLTVIFKFAENNVARISDELLSNSHTPAVQRVVGPRLQPLEQISGLPGCVLTNVPESVPVSDLTCAWS